MMWRIHVGVHLVVAASEPVNIGVRSIAVNVRSSDVAPRPQPSTKGAWPMSSMLDTSASLSGTTQ
jgi:hypothetical protein